MLKKQTVWLLTMLSLMIVLSVYYIMSDSGEYAFDQNEEQTEEVNEENTAENEPANSETVAPEQESGSKSQDEGTKVDEFNQTDQNELFASLRMQIKEERGMKKERLQDVVTSSTASPDEINAALNNMDEIDETSTKEKTLEQLIMSDSDYKDVFVRSNEDQVQVHIMGDDIPQEEAVNIMKQVEDEFGNVDVNISKEAPAS